MIDHPSRVAPTCPICGRRAAAPSADGRRSPAPFCSARCADVDLGRWFTGQYRVPVDGEADGDETAAPGVDRADVLG